MIFSSLKPYIRKDKVLARLGYTEKTSMSERVGSLIDACIGEAAALLNQKGCYKDINVKGIGEEKVDLDGMEIHSKDLAAFLSGCGKSTLFVVTIGPKLEQRMAEPSTHPAEASIFDAIGSEAAEELAEQASKLLHARALEQGYATTGRFSCGYGDWSLDDQRKIIDILNAGEIGITLTSSNMMVPQKSITAVVGWKSES